jgi:DNA-binding CsgD family transcriptional regulator
LTVITLRKCINHVEYFQAQCRDVHREVPLEPPAGASDASLLLLDREPTPLEAATLAETVEQLLSTFDAGDRPVIQLILEGGTDEEIGDRLGRAERTVKRLRKSMQRRLERLQREGPDEP